MDLGLEFYRHRRRRGTNPKSTFRHLRSYYTPSWMDTQTYGLTTSEDPFWEKCPPPLSSWMIQVNVTWSWSYLWPHQDHPKLLVVSRTVRLQKTGSRVPVFRTLQDADPGLYSHNLIFCSHLFLSSSVFVGIQCPSSPVLVVVGRGFRSDYSHRNWDTSTSTQYPPPPPVEVTRGRICTTRDSDGTNSRRYLWGQGIRLRPLLLPSSTVCIVTRQYES